MSKITFRADEELVERIEARDASKSEIMREALREYLEREDAERGDGTDAERARDAAGESHPSPQSASGRGTADALGAVLTERVDELVTERLDAWEARRRDRETDRAQDVNVNVTLESEAPVREATPDASEVPATSDDSADARTSGAKPTQDAGSETTCGQCGETLSDDHVYCPNCGEKAARRVFCECGDEVRSDWGFCPSCGRRTPAADVLDQP